MTVGTATHGHLAAHEHDPSRAQQMGVLLLIVADAAFVLSMVFTYFYLRGLNTDGGWITKGSSAMSPANGWIIAAIIVVSAIAYLWGEQGGRAGRRGRLLTGTALALVLALADLAVQVWRMVTMPGSVGTDAYNSTVMLMGGAQVFHLVITLMLGLAIYNRTRRGLVSKGSLWHARVVGYWWAWVAVSAVIVAFCTTFGTV